MTAELSAVRPSPEKLALKANDLSHRCLPVGRKFANRAGRRFSVRALWKHARLPPESTVPVLTALLPGRLDIPSCLNLYRTVPLITFRTPIAVDYTAMAANQHVVRGYFGLYDN